MAIDIVHKSQASRSTGEVDIGYYCVKVVAPTKHVPRFDRIVAFDDLVPLVEQLVCAE